MLISSYDRPATFLSDSSDHLFIEDTTDLL